MKYLKLWEGAAPSPKGKPLVFGPDRITYNLTNGKQVVVTKQDIQQSVIKTLKNNTVFKMYGAEMEDQMNRIKVPKFIKPKAVSVLRNYVKEILANPNVQVAFADLISTMLTSSNRFRWWTLNGQALCDTYDIQPVKMSVAGPKIATLLGVIKETLPAILRPFVTLDEKDCQNPAAINNVIKQQGIVVEIVSVMINTAYRDALNGKLFKVMQIDKSKLGTAIEMIDKVI